jgi:hypothetical protein
LWFFHRITPDFPQFAPEIGERSFALNSSNRTVINLTLSNKTDKTKELITSFSGVTQMNRIFAAISYFIDDYPIPFAIFALFMAIVTHHYSGSWHSYVPHS